MAESKSTSVQELLFDALRIRHDKHVEIGKLLERKRALEAELKQLDEKAAELRHQMQIHNREVEKYCREIAGSGTA